MIEITLIPFKNLSLEGGGFTNPRTSIDNRSIAELADSIEAQGLMVPLRVWTLLDDPKTHVVIAGSRRVRAIEKLLEEKRAPSWVKDGIPCVLVVPETAAADGDPATAQQRTLVLARVDALCDNLQRENLTSFEVATEMKALRDSGIAGKEIATMISKSQAWVSRHLTSLESASKNVQSAWKSGKLPDDDVQHLAKLKVEDENGKMVPDHEAQDKRLEKLLEHRAAAAANPKEKKANLAKARETAKGKPTLVKPATDLVVEFIATLAKVAKTERYLQGLRDGLRFAIGELGPGEFGKEFSDYTVKIGMSSTDRAAEPETKTTPKVTNKVAPLGTVGKEKATKAVPYKGEKGLWWVHFSNGMKFGYPGRAAARKATANDEVGKNGRVA